MVNANLRGVNTRENPCAKCSFSPRLWFFTNLCLCEVIDTPRVKNNRFLVLHSKVDAFAKMLFNVTLATANVFSTKQSPLVLLFNIII